MHIVCVHACACVCACLWDRERESARARERAREQEKARESGQVRERMREYVCVWRVRTNLMSALVAQKRAALAETCILPCCGGVCVCVGGGGYE